MAARSGGRPNGCMRDLSDNHTHPGQTQSTFHATHPAGFLADDDPPPFVGIQLVRPRLHRKRLRRRALQLDTSHTTATNRQLRGNHNSSHPRQRTDTEGAATACALDTPGRHGCANALRGVDNPSVTVTTYPFPQTRRKRIDITYGNVSDRGFFHWVGLHHPAFLIPVECRTMRAARATPNLINLEDGLQPFAADLAARVAVTDRRPRATIGCPKSGHLRARSGRLGSS
jgi:hypothetical protein